MKTTCPKCGEEHEVSLKHQKLTYRQERFCWYYTNHSSDGENTIGNATKAAIRAGYSEKAAATTGSLLLKNPKIREKIGVYAEDAWQAGQRRLVDNVHSESGQVSNAAIKILAQIRGEFAPIKHAHLHAHVGAGEPMSGEESERIAVVIMRQLGAGARQRVLAGLADAPTTELELPERIAVEAVDVGADRATIDGTVD